MQYNNHSLYYLLAIVQYNNHSLHYSRCLILLPTRPPGCLHQPINSHNFLQASHLYRLHLLSNSLTSFVVPSLEFPNQLVLIMFTEFLLVPLHQLNLKTLELFEEFEGCITKILHIIPPIIHSRKKS